MTGLAGAEFAEVFSGALGDGGHVVFAASLDIGTGGVTAGNDEGVWLADSSAGNDIALLAREGVGNVPDLTGANFESFSNAAVDGLGNVGIRAKLASGGGISSNNDEGWWRYSGGTSSLVARTGSGDVPDPEGASFANLPSELHMAGDGQSAFSGVMLTGGGVTTDNNNALWSYDGADGSLVAREGSSSVPGVGTATFKSLGIPLVNQSNQLAFTGSLNQIGVVTSDNDTGVWRYTGTSGTLIAREGVGNVPDVEGATFLIFKEPALNNTGQVAIAATLQDAGSGDQGVWLYDGVVGTLLAQKSIGSVPDLPGAKFASFDAPLLSNGGEVLQAATLELGAGGVAAGDESGLWMLGDSDRLIARTGSAGVPAVADANFLELTTVALNASGDVALAATLEIGTGGVTAGDDAGIWIFDSQGEGLLVARKGDTLAGQTIETLGFLGGSGGGDGRAQGLNAAGQLAFDVTFNNGDSGLFLYSPGPLFSADFDRDNDVDGQDLAKWRAAYGKNANADADGDLDTDGDDLLIWQRQFGSGTASLVVPDPGTVTVPEPTTGTLLWTIAGLIFCRQRQRRAQKFSVH